MLELTRSLGIHVKTVQSKTVGNAWANTVDATPPPSDAEVDHRDLDESDSPESESEEVANEVVSFQEHMLDPAPAVPSTKDSPIHLLNAEDVMLVLRSRNASKYGIGVATRLGVVFSVDPVRSLVVIKADPNADDKGAKNKVRWFQAADVDTYRHDEILLNGTAVVVAIDTTRQYVFWRYLDQRTSPAAASPAGADKTADDGAATDTEKP